MLSYKTLDASPTKNAIMMSSFKKDELSSKSSKKQKEEKRQIVHT